RDFTIGCLEIDASFCSDDKVCILYRIGNLDIFPDDIEPGMKYCTCESDKAGTKSAGCTTAVCFGKIFTSHPENQLGQMIEVSGKFFHVFGRSPFLRSEHVGNTIFTTKYVLPVDGNINIRGMTPWIDTGHIHGMDLIEFPAAFDEDFTVFIIFECHTDCLRHSNAAVGST